MRVSPADANLPDGVEEFCLSVTSEMSPEDKVFETVSEPIPAGKELHLFSMKASRAPIAESESIPDYLRVELLWRVSDGIDVIDHAVDKTYATIFEEVNLQGTFTCLDGVKMFGDGVSASLVIRRSIVGDGSVQDTTVTVRGYVA